MEEQVALYLSTKSKGCSRHFGDHFGSILKSLTQMCLQSNSAWIFIQEEQIQFGISNFNMFISEPAI